MAGFKLPVEPKSRRARSESHCAFLSEMRDREGGTSSESEAALGFTSAANSEMLPQPKPRRIRDHSIFIPSSNELGQRDSFLRVRILAMSDYRFGGQHYDYCVCPVCRKVGGDHHGSCICATCKSLGGDHYGFCVCPLCGNMGAGHFAFCACPVCKKLG
jgi:hypothetical protein